MHKLYRRRWWPIVISGIPKKAYGVHDLDAIFTLATQIHTLLKKFDTLAVPAIQSLFVACELCGGNHLKEQCPSNVESIQYVANFNRQQNNPHSNFYNPGWKNHPNVSWINN